MDCLLMYCPTCCECSDWVSGDLHAAGYLPLSAFVLVTCVLVVLDQLSLPD